VVNGPNIFQMLLVSHYAQSCSKALVIQWVRSRSKGSAEPDSRNLGIPCVKCVSFGLSL